MTRGTRGDESALTAHCLVGFRLSWLAVKGAATEHVLSTLGLVDTGETEKLPESEFDATRVGDWLIVVQSITPDLQPLFPDLLRLESGDDGPMVLCSVDEQTMQSNASLRQRGAVVWLVEHDAQRAPEDLRLTGELPGVFDSIRHNLSQAQAGSDAVDYIFDAPIELARYVTGFRHDEGEHEFNILERM
jgi:hypothetical protein